MEDKGKADNDGSYIDKAIDITVKVGMLLLIIGACFQIIRPFISIILWSIIIAVVFNPLFVKVSKKLGDRKKLTSLLFILTFFVIIGVPGYFLGDSMYDGIRDFSRNIDNKTLNIPPPPPKIEDWPLVGGTISGIWQMASDNFESAVKKYGSKIMGISKKILNILMGAGIGIFQFILSVILAGILMASAKDAATVSRNIFLRLVGNRAGEFSEISQLTIQNVVKNILGLAVLQSLLCGIIFILAGVPYAGLWTLLVLLLSIIQIGPGPVTIPVIVYFFSTLTLVSAVVWTILLIMATIVDNVLKPFVIGKGTPVPGLVIFLGAIGGMMAFGFLGFFLGAIILSLGYRLFTVWLNITK